MVKVGDFSIIERKHWALGSVRVVKLMPAQCFISCSWIFMMKIYIFVLGV